MNYPVDNLLYLLWIIRTMFVPYRGGWSYGLVEARIFLDIFERSILRGPRHLEWDVWRGHVLPTIGSMMRLCVWRKASRSMSSFERWLYH